jgi:two-component sensor histidine kinase
MRAVRRYDILDSPPDGAFDRITAIAARRFKVPISIISVVDDDRIWFKSHHGLEIEQIPREPGLCASAILGSEPRVLPDTTMDPVALSNPLVSGGFGLRFYAGAPLRTHDGYSLGTLCVIDQEPHPVTQEMIDDLKDLASVVMDQMELRLAARRAVGHATLMAREIDHRVMNSLQFVSSTLALQSMAPDIDEAAAEQLQMAANRVAAVGQVHRNFYADGSDETPCVAFLQRLCRELSEILGRTIEVSGDEANVPTAQVQSIGLIVNELVTNAAKHGAGKISVIHTVEDDRRLLSVCDEGAGLPAGFDPAASKSLGMKVLMSLVRKLRGQLTVGHGDGTQGGFCMTITIPD